MPIKGVRMLNGTEFFSRKENNIVNFKIMLEAM